MLNHRPPKPALPATLEHGRAAPILLVVTALLVSTLIFFFITRPKLEKAAQMQEPHPAKVDDTAAQQAAAATAPAMPSPQAASAPKPAAPAMDAPPSFGFARPLDLGKDLARSLAAGDLSRAAALLAANDPTQTAAAAAMLEKMIRELGAKPGSEDQVELLGIVENKTRLSLPLLKDGSSTPMRLQLDLERDERMGWKVTRVELPKELAEALPMPTTPRATAAGMIPAAPPGTAPAATAPIAPAETKVPPLAMKEPEATRPPLFRVSSGDDALTFGSDFVRALLRHDFAEARKFVDEKKVPAERLAGLCIVFEEGQYEFKPTKPLIITVANPEVSWVIAQVQSPSLQQSTEFGLELQRAGTDQPWRVVGLNLSEILGSFAASATKLGVPYTPIVKNPTGGESLALYFEYDQAQLHPRAKKQLEIVAGLLKSDPGKKLHIAGHTDAKGTDDYNLRLSSMRAETGKQQLTALGVSEAQITPKGLGKPQPLSPNQKADGTDDPEGRSKNRRAEIFLDF
ncbi:MAG: OmpA family protein [Prosthecobacter sp.]|nr:OmpA family protein [Prosthecobacter sp.]